jgi:triosephosphate isomerase
MNKTVDEAVDFVQEFLPMVKDQGGTRAVLAPPATSLYPVSRALKDSDVLLAAQNMHWEPDGAFTGEVSAVMLRDVGCGMVIIGHSERRQYFAEGDGEVASKVAAAIQEGIVPILCVGETLGERDYGKTFEVIERQVRGGLEGAVVEGGKDLVLAYEPVWAIGTGKTATPEEAQEVHAFIRGLLTNVLGAGRAGEIRILYGGSVKPGNVKALMAMNDINGALVGGASLQPESFAALVNH